MEMGMFRRSGMGEIFGESRRGNQICRRNLIREMSIEGDFAGRTNLDESGQRVLVTCLEQAAGAGHSTKLHRWPC